MRFANWIIKATLSRRLRVFENRVLRRVFGPKRDEVTCRLVDMVPVYGTCQWTAAGTFRYGAKAENPEFLYNFNWRFSSAGTGTDRLLTERGDVLITQHCGRLLKVYLSLAILPT
jgi:hypothetical protein